MKCMILIGIISVGFALDYTDLISMIVNFFKWSSFAEKLAIFRALIYFFSLLVLDLSIVVIIFG